MVSGISRPEACYGVKLEIECGTLICICVCVCVCMCVYTGSRARLRPNQDLIIASYPTISRVEDNCLYFFKLYRDENDKIIF